MRPPKLTPGQKARLASLEPSLRLAVRRGDYEAAKRIVTDLQSVLRPTGHETRLMQAKNWLFEAAMEAGQLQIAIAGLEGVRQRVARSTRIHLEATSLLAICHIRARDLRRAEPLMAEALLNDEVIKSPRRRHQFRARIVARFQQEGVLVGLRGEGADYLDPLEIEAQAGVAVQTQTEDEIFAEVARALPSSTVAFLTKVDLLARRQLPSGELKYLPPPPDLAEKTELGRTASASLNRVLWRSLCDPESEVYKAWYTNGMAFVLSKKYIGGCVVAAFGGFGIGLKGLAISVAALVIRFGIDIYCDMFKPEGVMIARSE